MTNDPTGPPKPAERRERLKTEINSAVQPGDVAAGRVRDGEPVSDTLEPPPEPGGKHGEDESGADD